MAIARRDLLGITAAVAFAVATGSCAGPEGITYLADPAPTPTAGDFGPGFLPDELPPGFLYYGASVPYGRSVTAWEEQLGSPLALHRSYFTPDRNEASQLIALCRDDLSNRRLPHVSVKPAGTWGDIASGRRDEWLASMLEPLGRNGFTAFFTLAHEPENDAGPPGMSPSDFVGMQRRAIRLAAELAPRVVIVPVLQHWTFSPMRFQGNPGSWLVEEAPVYGIDLYNAWSPVNGKEWRSFGSKFDEVIGWFGDKRLVVGEYGCRINAENPGLAAEWLRDAADYARSHNVISMSYFNSAVDAVDGTWELSGETEAAFAELLASEWVARPPLPLT
jgi:hypothetical protein